MLVGVGGEDLLDGRCFIGIGDETLGRRVDVVAEWSRTPQPLPSRRLALEAFGDAIDEQATLELGEDPEQLEQHAADRPLGVDRLGGRTQRHPGGVERLDDGHQADDRAGEPVDPVGADSGPHLDLYGTGSGHIGR
ncbi:MAG TPA: hypothetical protein VND62_02490 [Acidimicrobiales bacterium]|nr:hypothetical protein [Acidimicrobiales bacterium]